MLENPRLASQLYQIGGGWKQAGLEARQRLANLIEPDSETMVVDWGRFRDPMRIECHVRISADREREDRSIVNTKIGPS